MFVIIRIFVNWTDPYDIKAGNRIQDSIEAPQKSIGNFEIPAWDKASLKKIRDAVNVLAVDLPSYAGCFGDKSQLDPILSLLGTASGRHLDVPELSKTISSYVYCNLM